MLHGCHMEISLRGQIVTRDAMTENEVSRGRAIVLISAVPAAEKLSTAVISMMRGGLVPCRREQGPNGDLVLAIAEALMHEIDTCMLAVTACRGKRIVLLSPLPRYISANCCSDNEHVPKR